MTAVLKKDEAEKNSFGPELILYVHSRFYRQTPPCCPLIVHEEERRPSSQTDRNSCRKKKRLCPNSEADDLIDIRNEWECFCSGLVFLIFYLLRDQTFAEQNLVKFR